MRQVRMLLLLSVAALHSQSAAAQVRPSAERHAFELSVLAPPRPVRVGSRTLIPHELHLTNFTTHTLLVQRVRVLEARSGQVLLDLQGKELAAALGAVAGASADKRAILPGARAVAYLDAPIDEGSDVRAVRHVVEFAERDSAEPRDEISGAEVPVHRGRLRRLSPPLRGGPWVAVYDPMLERGHRRVVYAVGGRARIPGRFAVDWMPAGPSSGGIGGSGLGEEVLAVADGTIANLRDGVPEPAPGSPRPRVSTSDATGNFVSIDIGGGLFAFYEHLMPGLTVKMGQRVRRGQVIGRLGSTGQASRPHLHFHVADANSPLGAEGVPYLLSEARVTGAYESIEAFQTGAAWKAQATVSSTLSFPAPNAVLDFDKTPAAHP